MTSESPKKIYISARDPDLPGLPGFDADALLLLDGLRREGFDVYWEKNFREYEIIEREIAACDALLAIADSTWMCSTWGVSEFHYARGISSGMTNNPGINPLPVFLYPVVDLSQHWLGTAENSMLLDRDVGPAIDKIKATLLSVDSAEGIS